MKILLVGTWREKKAKKIQKEAKEVGQLLAERKHILISGGGTGVSKIVVESYKSNKGKKYIAYFPSEKEMKKVGEKRGPAPDQAIKTSFDYPERNVKMVKFCYGLIALRGGLGALTEIIHAVKDYNKKVAVIDKGELALWIKMIPELKRKVYITDNILKAIIYLEK